MTKLISIWDFEILPNQKLNRKSLYLTEALKRMRNRNQYHQEDFEDIICPFELILVLDEVANDFENYRGNKNANIKEN